MRSWIALERTKHEEKGHLWKQFRTMHDAEAFRHSKSTDGRTSPFDVYSEDSFIGLSFVNDEVREKILYGNGHEEGYLSETYKDE